MGVTIEKEKEKEGIPGRRGLPGPGLALSSPVGRPWDRAQKGTAARGLTTAGPDPIDR